jgi:hypothetical protein
MAFLFMCQGCLRKLILGSRSWFGKLWVSIRLNLICLTTLSVMGFVMWMLGCFVLLKAYVVRNTYLSFSMLTWPSSLLMMTAYSLEDWVWCFHWGMIFWWRCGNILWGELLLMNGPMGWLWQPTRDNKLFFFWLSVGHMPLVSYIQEKKNIK